jgi:hypothetical protein
MIPLAIPAVLKAVPWKLVGYAVAVLAILALGWRISVWRDAYKAIPEVQAALAAEVACLAPSKCAERVAALQAAHKAINDQTARDYETRIAEIAARPVPREPVRLCRPARPSGVRVPSASPATSPSQGADFPTEIGRDIAVELYGLADDADREALKLELLWGRDVALATVPEKP